MYEPIKDKANPYYMKLTAEWSEFPALVLKAIKSGHIPKDRDYNVINPTKWTRAERMMAFIERECKVPEGKLTGSPMVLLPFQRAFVRAIYDNPAETARAILSVARKQGKTGLVAPLLLGHIIGPEAKKNSQTVSGAMTKEQAGLLFVALYKIATQNPEMMKRLKATMPSKQALGIATGVTYKALAREGSSAQGLSPVVAVLDETGQVIGPSDSFVDAVVTAQGAHESPLLFVISTQSASDSDLLSVMIDDAERSGDAETVAHVYTSTPDCELMDKMEWYQSNPALGVFRSESDLRRQMERAQRLPSAEPSARNLLLNQRVSLLTLAVAPAVWKKNADPVIEELFRQGHPVHLGLDLSQRNDLTACVAAVKDPQTEKVHVLPFCFTPMEGLKDRAHTDRTPYDVWVKDEKLTALPGSHMDYDMLAVALKNATAGMNIASVQFDRWRVNDFKPRAEAAGFATEANWIPVGQGFKDFGLRVDGLDSLLLQGKVCHGKHPLLNLGAANAIVVTDPTGSKKYDKSKSSQKIDPLVAMAMAVYPLSDGNVEAVNVDTMIF